MAFAKLRCAQRAVSTREGLGLVGGRSGGLYSEWAVGLQFRGALGQSGWAVMGQPGTQARYTPSLKWGSCLHLPHAYEVDCEQLPQLLVLSPGSAQAVGSW